MYIFQQAYILSKFASIHQERIETNRNEKLYKNQKLGEKFEKKSWKF